MLNLAEKRAVRHYHCRRVGSCAPIANAWRPHPSLPLVSILGILWLWHDTGDAERMAAHAQMTFSCVLPTFPNFLSDAGIAASRNRILVDACGLLHADFRLSQNDLDARKIRNDAVTL
jgi:hypothetical protein